MLAARSAFDHAPLQVYAISFWYGGQLVGEGNISFEQMLKV